MALPLPSYYRKLAEQDIDLIAGLLFNAGKIALNYQKQDARPMKVSRKDDDSRVTDADKRIDAYLRVALAGLIPEAEIISEENINSATQHLHRPPKGFSWYIDPIDGTDNYIAFIMQARASAGIEESTYSGLQKNFKFCIQMMLMRDGVPIAGFIYSPLDRALYWGFDDNYRYAERVELDADGNIVSRMPLRNRIEEQDKVRVDRLVGGVNYVLANTERLWPDLESAYNNLDVGNKQIVLLPGLPPSLLAMSMFDPKLYPLPENANLLIAIRVRDNAIWDLTHYPIVRAAGGQMTRLNGTPIFPNSTQGMEAPYNMVMLGGECRIREADSVAATCLIEKWKKILNDFPPDQSEIYAKIHQRFGEISRNLGQLTQYRIPSAHPALKGYCDALTQRMIQESAGDPKLQLVCQSMRSQLQANNLISPLRSMTRGKTSLTVEFPDVFSFLNGRQLSDISQTMIEAGAIALRYHSGSATALQTERKLDRSIVTAADKHIDSYLRSALQHFFPDIPIYSEESFKDADKHNHRLPPGFAWYIDPIDGTNNFAERDPNRKFTVQIMLMKDGVPVAGFVYSPLDRSLYWGAIEGETKVAEKILYNENGVQQQHKPLKHRLPLNPNGTTYLISNRQRNSTQRCHDHVIADHKISAHLPELNPALLGLAPFDNDIWQPPPDARSIGITRELGNGPWDLAYLPIVQAAGGDMTTFSGKPIFPAPVAGVEAPHNILYAGTPITLHSPEQLSAMRVHDKWTRRFQDEPLKSELANHPELPDRFGRFMHVLKQLTEARQLRQAGAHFQRNCSALLTRMIREAEEHPALSLAFHTMQSELQVNGLLAAPGAHINRIS